MHNQSWLIFGGPYGNLQATQALLAEARSLAIPAERMLCTGDLVAYCGDPVDTIDLVRDAGIPVVMGNCDEQLAAGADDCGCGFDPESTCARLSADWYAYANTVIRSDQRAWLATLPKRIDLEIGGRSLAAIHGSARVINEFIFAGTPVSAKQDGLDALGCDGVIGGHCGLPFSENVEGRLWHNPGVIGMPANDGTARVWFSLVTPTEVGISVEHRALQYNHQAAQAAMRRVGLPNCYRDALASGLWPSLDVLPQRERALTGIHMSETRFLWEKRTSSSLVAAA